MDRIWVGAALSLGAIAIAALAAWPFLGRFWALAVFVAGLLLLGAHHLLNLDRLERWMREPLGTPVPDGSGAWEYIFSGLSRRARKAMRQSEELSYALDRFRTAGQAMPDGVVILNQHNHIEWMNATAGEHLGLDAAKDAGSPIVNLVRQPDFVIHLESGRYGEPVILHPLRRPGLTLALQVIQFGDRQKLILSRDVTQIEKLETMRRDFVANVSHELRTPLTVVNGFIETLADNLRELKPEEAENYLRLAHEQAERMRRLIDDLLTLSALETGAPPPASERVDVRTLVAEVAEEARTLSAGRHAISAEIEGGAALLGSARELRSAFSNLASNAVRYTPAGGSIRLSWRTDADGGVLAVEDTGIGIEAPHIPRLTERFYRVDRGRSRETGGTGLGLAIVKHVLTRHQAVLEIESEPGHGSRFMVRFPLRRVVAAEKTAA